MMLMTGFLPTLNIVGEKEAGTIEQMNVTPVSKWSFILAKLIPYWLIALFVITVCLVLAWLVYGITPTGPPCAWCWRGLSMASHQPVRCGSSTCLPCCWRCSSRRSDSSCLTTLTLCSRPCSSCGSLW